MSYNKMRNYWFLKDEETVKTRIVNGVRHIEINGKLLDKIQIDEAMKELPEEEFQAVYAKFVLGATYEEVAELIGKPYSTARRRVKSGLMKIKKALDIA